MISKPRPEGWNRSSNSEFWSKIIPGRKLSKCKYSEIKVIRECVKAGDQGGAKRSKGKVGRCWNDKDLLSKA